MAQCLSLLVKIHERLSEAMRKLRQGESLSVEAGPVTLRTNDS